MRSDRPSHTAIKIARGLVLLGQIERYAELLPEGAAAWSERLTLAAGVMKPWMVRLYTSAWFRGLVLALDRWLMPGQLLGSVLRKRFVDDQTRAAIGSGASQVLVVGSGLDTLCLRLAPVFEEVTFVDLDHPSTMRLKKQGVATLGAARDNLHLAAVDLSTDTLEDTLVSIDAWRPDAPSVVIAEGVLMYLDPSDVVGFLGAVRRVSAPGSRLVVTLIEERVSPWLRFSLRMVGETLRWGIARDAVPSFLSKHGFALIEGSPDLRAAYLEPAGRGAEPLPFLEHVAVARSD